MELVSVIIITKNHSRYLKKCLDSILKQSYENFEVIIVDDNSSDNTKEVLETFRDNIKYFENNQNMGLPYSLNFGIKNSLGRFIVRVDSDDYVNNDYLKILLFTSFLYSFWKFLKESLKQKHQNKLIIA